MVSGKRPRDTRPGTSRGGRTPTGRAGRRPTGPAGPTPAGPTSTGGGNEVRGTGCAGGCAKPTVGVVLGLVVLALLVWAGIRSGS